MMPETLEGLKSRKLLDSGRRNPPSFVYLVHRAELTKMSFIDNVAFTETENRGGKSVFSDLIKRLQNRVEMHHHN